MTTPSKRLSQCVVAIRRSFRELAAFYLLPTPTARALALHLSEDSFEAITTIVINAEIVLYNELRVISKSDLYKLTRFKSVFNALAYGKEGVTTDHLEFKRKTLYSHFSFIYNFLHFALSQLLPITYDRSCPSTVVVSTSHTFNLQFAKIWLLAVALLPQDVAVRHLKAQAHAIELSVFREIASNLLSGWFQLNTALQAKLVEKFKEPLTKLAGSNAGQKETYKLLIDCYPAIKLACDILTHYGCRELFPGFVPWQTPKVG